MQRSPSWKHSVPPLDSITALGRLLRDGPLRDAYAAAPLRTLEALGVAAEDRGPLLDLDPAGLETQARVLLRKRFDAVSRLIPATLANLGELAWPSFAEYARAFWPAGPASTLEDGEAFSRRLCGTHPHAVSRSDQNRLRFARQGKRVGLHFARDLPFRGGRRAGLQLLWRRPSGQWRELALHLAC